MCIDYIRDKIQNNQNLPYYYKYNTVLFINKNNNFLIKKFIDFRSTKNAFKISFIYLIRKKFIHKMNYKLVNILVYIKFILKNLFK